jgi:hypothetical protein
MNLYLRKGYRLDDVKEIYKGSPEYFKVMDTFGGLDIAYPATDTTVSFINTK